MLLFSAETKMCGMGLSLGLQHWVCTEDRSYCWLQCLSNLLGKGQPLWCLLGVMGSFVSRSHSVRPGFGVAQRVCEGSLQPWFVAVSGNTNAVMGRLFLSSLLDQSLVGHGAPTVLSCFESVEFARLSQFFSIKYQPCTRTSYKQPEYF